MERKCIVCGGGMEGRHHKSNVCSEPCRVEQQRKNNRKANQRYREANPDRWQDIVARHRTANREALTEKSRQYRKLHPEKTRQTSKQYRESNSDKVKERVTKYRNANIDAIRERDRKAAEQFRKSHPDKRREQRRRERSKIQATRAAALLTETLGVPHVVVETVDPKTGRKDWQPKPKGD